jgi:hypothetical protein
VRSATRLAAFVVFVSAATAQAYPWMIRHGYTVCSSCHVDPSGSGLLTAYGRAQDQIVIPTLYGKSPEEVEPTPGILFGAVPLPDWLDVGLSFRGALNTVTTSQGTSFRDILMIGDLRFGVTPGPFIAVVTIGYVPTGARQAALTNNYRDNIVSREHYLGLALFDKRLVIRAGRMNLPFGLRNVEHPTYVRSSTRTDINSSQQYGVAVAYDGPRLRAELMGIVGNFLIRTYPNGQDGQFDPSYREHGYSGYAEWAFSPRFTVGLSSLVTHADRALPSITTNLAPDPFAGAADSWRQAHGAFSRWYVGGPVVLLAEANLLIQSAQGVPRDYGGVGFLQADVEPLQGLHFIGTAEALHQFGFTNYGFWAGVSWFFFTYCEARVDTVFSENGTPTGYEPSFTVLAQLHLSF